MYVTVDAVIAAWRTSIFPSPLAIEESIAWVSEFIDRTTRQWFEPRTLTVFLDGPGSSTLLLPVPVISITSLYVNDDFANALAVDEYAVYSSKGLSDDRRNPRIRLIEDSFQSGTQNIKIVGSFGFVDDGTPPATPPGIRRACLKIVLRDLQSAPGGGGSTIRPAGPLQMETVDKHQVLYAAPRFGARRSSTFAVTGDSEVDDILASYRAPIIIGASSSFASATLE